MYEKLTDTARRVVVLAQEHARACNHSYIGTEHVLLGLLDEGESPAADALASMGISLAAARQEIEAFIGQGPHRPSGHIPLTARAKTVLDATSLHQAQQLGNGFIAPEHILLALADDRDGVAAQILVKLGADLDRAPRVVLDSIRAATEGAGSSQIERLRAEIGRLRRLLSQHGIDPADAQ